MKITEHVVDVFLDFVPIDVQEQGKGEGFVDFITVGNKIQIPLATWTLKKIAPN